MRKNRDFIINTIDGNPAEIAKRHHTVISSKKFGQIKMDEWKYSIVEQYVNDVVIPRTTLRNSLILGWVEFGVNLDSVTILI